MANAGTKSFGIWPPSSGSVVASPVEAGCRSYLLWPLGSGCVSVEIPQPPTPIPPPVAVFGGGGSYVSDRLRLIDRLAERRLARLREDDVAVVLAVVEFVLLEDDSWELSPIA